MKKLVEENRLVLHDEESYSIGKHSPHRGGLSVARFWPCYIYVGQRNECDLKTYVHVINDSQRHVMDQPTSQG